MIRIHALCIFGVALSLPAFAGTTVTVDVPCSNTPEPGLRLCKDVIERDLPATANLAAKPSMVSQLRDRVKEQIDGNPAKHIGGYYQNVDPDPQSASTVPNAGGPQGTPGTFFGPTVCNLVAGETTLDHHGKSCGNPTNIQVRGNLDIVAGCVTGARVVVTPYRRFSQGEGTLEDGYLRGGLIAATNCFHESIKNDLISKKAVIVSDIGGQPSECLELAKDINHLNAEFKTKSTLLKKQLTQEQANIADIMNCGKSWDTSKATRPDQGPLRQSAQLLCAAQQSIETMITQLAACEVFARAKSAHLKALSDPAAIALIFDKIRQDIAEPCGTFCTGKFAVTSRECNPPTDAELSSCANKCYMGTQPGAQVPSIKDVLKRMIEDKWPANGSNCKQSMLKKTSNTLFAGDFSLFLLMGSLGGLRRRRKVVTTFWVVLALGAGCSANTPVAPHVPDPDSCKLTGQPPECCPLNLGGPTCEGPTQGGGGMRGAMAGAAIAANTASGALDAATKLIGGDGTENITGGTLAQGEAASAGDANTTTSAAPPKPGNTGGGHGSGGAGLRAGKPGGGVGGGAATGMSLSDLKTGIATSSETAPTTAAATTADGAYQSGATGGTETGGSDPYRFRSDRGIEGGAGNTEVGFNADVSGESGQVLGNEDPTDYFTRMGLDENIFKKVEKRYREKSMNWVTADLKGGAPGLK